MARCTLDLNHPIFQRAISRWEDDLGFHEGLRRAAAKIEAEHTSCGMVIQPMPKRPECQNKIWKYDWAPEGQSGGTRKTWRMIVIVPDPSNQPYHLVAAAIYQKSSTDQLSAKQLAAILASITTPIRDQELHKPEKFRRVMKNIDPMLWISICADCGEAVGESALGDELDVGEASHDCSGPISAKI